MMFEFLCLVGPGIVSWFVCRRILCCNGKESAVLLSLFEIIVYSILNMAVVINILQPYGKVQIIARTDGMPAVHYGASALLLSVIVAVFVGILGALASGKIWYIDVSCAIRQRGKVILYLAFAVISVIILQLRIGSPDGYMGMHISTIPVKLNNVTFNTDLPLYYSDVSQDYFISAEKLAEGLGISYEKNPGLFRDEYVLGNGKFWVSRISPGEDFYKKGKDLFIRLSYLGNSELFEEIHVHSGSVLADGKGRESIYIDNYPQRFQYAWTESKYIAHALGGIDKQAYTNSLEAFQENYKNGHRVFEVDLRLTADDSLVATHDLPLNDEGKLMTLKEFKRHKGLGQYTSLSFKDIVRLMKKYPDFYLVTDTKETQSPYIEKQFRYMVEVAKELDSEVLTRIIPQIYNEEMFFTIMDIYNWNSMIYTLYALNDFSEKEVADFAYREGIQIITTHSGRAQPLFLDELFERDINVYMHTYNILEDVQAVESLGVHGVYTDFLYPGSEDK